MKTLFPAPGAARPIEPSMKMYAAIIAMDRVYVATARSLNIAEDRACSLSQSKNIIGVVFPRLCTEQSMRVEAERIRTTLFGEDAPTSAESFANRALFGGHDAIRAKIAEINADAMRAARNEQQRLDAARHRQREGQSHLEALFGRNARERRERSATYL